MGKLIKITESQLKKIVKNVIINNNEINESLFSRLFHKPDISDASKSALKSQGYSQIAKDDENELYIVFNGEKFYPNDVEYADNYDTGEIPRVEDGKLIIANPMWRE